jgi:hypothetical protein
MSANQEESKICSISGEHFKMSMLSEMMKDGLSRLLEIFGDESFTFVVKDQNVKNTFAEALLISPSVYSAFQCENTLRTFKLCEDGIDENDFVFFLTMIRNEIEDNIEMSEQRELSFLSIFRSLGNERLSLQLLSLMHLTDCKGTSTNNFVRSHELMKNESNVNYCASQFYSYSINELSRLDRNTLHALLSEERLKIEDEDSLLGTLIELGSQYYEYWQYIKVCFLSSSGISTFVGRLPFDEVRVEIWEQICHRLKNDSEDEIRDIRFVWSSISKILISFPPVLNVLKPKQWTLLYRGSDHGFNSSNFHSKCDGKSNTITIILTTVGFIFGGLTPITWDSSNSWKTDARGQSFLFSVKNPHNRDFGRIGLQNQQNAIFCHSSHGPTFGNSYDLYIANCCNGNTSSSTNVGNAYVNNTSIPGPQVFAGQQNFTVKEIEVFALTD